MPSPNHFDGRDGQTPRFIICHGTAGFTTAQQTAQYFADPDSQVSSNYVIGKDGTIVQCVADEDGSWANGILEAGHDPWWSESINPNYQTISIEHLKFATDNSDVLTSEQQTASFALIDMLCTKWNIPRQLATAQGGITGHYSISPQSRARCPGPYPWDALISYLQGGSTMSIPTGWHDNGHTLTAPNGVPVVAGFRDYVLAHNWDANNWPLQAEQGRTPLELSNPSLGGGTAQDFRYTTLEWTSSKGVFVAWTGVELQALRAALVTATTTSTTPDNSTIITALNIASTTITTLTTDLTAANTAIQQSLTALK
jgi:hypothetical protein